ncbi:GT2 family glycosyltransferase [Rhodoblastus acidophilus]|uniref:glycosyltransferase family A protein n=1 Tax=Rhodoblastus acidophilus TaxID=1074 RepID=UPI002223FC94|nr:glycosyltransferase family A protein [Rhodoblastus acidophilus]MCW2317539.1 GT2 family glycosyltransferase [Rhodoblastus acidophilus]
MAREGLFDDLDWANEANAPFYVWPAARRWDLVLTCGDRLAPGAGGVGEDILQLVAALTAEAPGRAILLICAEPVDAQAKPALAGVCVLVAPPRRYAFGRYVHFLEAAELRFAYAAAELLADLQRRGHEFALACCPDRGAEAFYLQKMRRHGQLRIDGLTLRLYGPTALDMAGPLCDVSPQTRNLLVEEIACLQRADLLAHRDDALFARVAKLCQRFGFDPAPRGRREDASLWSALTPSAQPARAEPADLPVGFVIPHFNATEYIEDCLVSTRACAEDGDEILVVDDASRADEKTALRAMIARLNAEGGVQIALHELPHNSGPAAARNAGVARLTRAQALQFIDADDALNPDGFRATRRALRLNPDLAMVYGLQRNFGADRFYWVTMDANPLTAFEENYCHSAPLVRRAAFEALGGQTPGMRYHYEDWEFNVRLCLSGLAGELVIAQTQHYRMGHASRTLGHLDRLDRSRQDLFAHIARAPLSGDPRRDRLAATLASYASMLERAGLLQPGAGQRRDTPDPPAPEPEPEPIVERRTVEIVEIVDLEERIKALPLPLWRRKLARFALSASRRIGGARRK